MTDSALLALCLRRKGAYLAYPFGDSSVCVKVGRHIFAQLYPSPERHWLTLKCEPMTGDFYHRRFPEDILPRAYCCPAAQQPCWFTLRLDGSVPGEELRVMIEHAYDAAVAKLTKREQQKLTEPDL